MGRSSPPISRCPGVASTSTAGPAAARFSRGSEHQFGAKRTNPPEMHIFFKRDEWLSDARRGERLNGLAERLGQRRMVGLEPDLGLLEDVDEAAVVTLVAGVDTAVVGAGGFEVLFDRAVKAGQLLPIPAVSGPPDGGREFVEQMTQVLFHRAHATGRAACT